MGNNSSINPQAAGPSFPDIVLTFGPAWWHQYYGMIYDRTFWQNPIARTERWRRQGRLLYERFGDVGLGEADPQPHPVAGDAYGHRFMSAFWGCEIQYVVDQFPSAIVLPHALERMRTQQVPILADSPAAEQLRSETRLLRQEYGQCEATINFGGPLNNAVSVLGADIYVVMKTQPELAHEVLQKMGEAVLLVYDQLVCPLNNLPAPEAHQRMFAIGDCPVGMISPRTYQEMVLPADLWVRNQFQGEFLLHHCGIFEPYAEVYRPLNFSIVDTGPGTDLRLTRAAYPDIPITTYLAVESLAGISRDELDAMLLKMTAQAAPARLFPTITVAEAGPEVPDQTVRDLLTAKQRLGFR